MQTIPSGGALAEYWHKIVYNTVNACIVGLVSLRW